VNGNPTTQKIDMYIVLENFSVTEQCISGIRDICKTNGERVILYHPKNIDELLKNPEYVIPGVIDLVSGAAVFIDRNMLKRLLKIGDTAED
jgi:hypothetical protein